MYMSELRIQKIKINRPNDHIMRKLVARDSDQLGKTVQVRRLKLHRVDRHQCHRFSHNFTQRLNDIHYDR